MQLRLFSALNVLLTRASASHSSYHFNQLNAASFQFMSLKDPLGVIYWHQIEHVVLIQQLSISLISLKFLAYWSYSLLSYAAAFEGDRSFVKSKRSQYFETWRGFLKYGLTFLCSVAFLCWFIFLAIITVFIQISLEISVMISSSEWM